MAHNVYDTLVERGLIAQCTNAEEVRKLLEEEQVTFYVTNDFSSGIKEHIKKTNSIKMSDFDFNSYITYLERNIKSLSKLWYSINA